MAGAAIQAVVKKMMKQPTIVPSTCLVNLFDLDPAPNGGTSRVAQELSRLLAGLARRGQVRVIFAVSWRMAAAFPQWVGDEQVEVIPCLPDVNLTALLKALPLDIIITPFYWMFPFDQPQRPGRPAHVVLIADTIPIELPHLFTPADIQRSNQVFTWGRHAARVVTPSAHARQSLLKLTQLQPDQLTVIPWAGDLTAAAEPVEPAVETIQPFVLYPANGLPHKRHQLLLQIMKKIWAVRPELRLVLTGYREPGYLDRLARQVDCPTERIIDLGYVSDGQLVALYRRAEAMLFTSQHEGFGLPLLEAMGQGCPVICAPLTSIPEVAGDAALYVNSDDPQAWAEALLTTLPEQRARLIEQGQQRVTLFSWERARQQWLQVLIEAGLELSPPQNLADFPDRSGFREANLTDLDVPLNVVRQELAVWSNEYAHLRIEVDAKEAEIQTLAAATRQQTDELMAKEAVIQQLLTFRKLSPGYWLFRGWRLASRYLKPLLSPQLGQLTQYPPRPLHIPAWYTGQPAPNPPPLISLVTPSFNQAQFLERTMQSVLAQNYPALEYIIQDGGSGDATPALLDRYRDRLAHAESVPDNGQAHALNLGFARTTGEIMAYLNSDDLLLPGALNTIAAYFAQHPEVDVVYGHRVVIDEDDNEIGRWVLPPHDDQVLRWADYIPQETLFWRRRMWAKSGGAMDESYKFALDWELLLRFQAAGAKIICLPRFLGAFRVHTHQKTSTQLADLGAAEMARLRRQCHGRPVSWVEIGRGLGPYMAKSVVYHWLYRLGLLKY